MNAAASNRPLLPAGSPPRFREASFLSLPVVIQQLADVCQFPFSSSSRRERAHQQRFGRAAERALEEISGKLPLGPLARPCGFVDVRALLLIAAYQPLPGH